MRNKTNVLHSIGYYFISSRASFQRLMATFKIQEEPKAYRLPSDNLIGGTKIWPLFFVSCIKLILEIEKHRSDTMIPFLKNGSKLLQLVLANCPTY